MGLHRPGRPLYTRDAPFGAPSAESGLGISGRLIARDQRGR